MYIDSWHSNQKMMLLQNFKRLPASAMEALVSGTGGAAMSSRAVDIGRRTLAYRSTTPVQNYLPMVLESTPRGERAYDIYSRLLRASMRQWQGMWLLVVWFPSGKRLNGQVARQIQHSQDAFCCTNVLLIVVHDVCKMCRTLKNDTSLAPLQNNRRKTTVNYISSEPTICWRS